LKRTNKEQNFETEKPEIKTNIKSEFNKNIARKLIKTKSEIKTNKNQN